MENNFRSTLRKSRAKVYSTFLTILLIICTSKSYGDTVDELVAKQGQTLKEASARVERLIASYLEHNTRQNPNDTMSPSSLTTLTRRIETLLESKFVDMPELVEVAQIIHEHLPAIRNNIDSNETALFIRILLALGDTQTAYDLSNDAFNNASYITGALVNYQLALHYFEREDNPNTQKHLLAIDSQEGFSESQQDFAQIMFAVSLQRQKEHRKAIKLYEKISKESNYYAYSQLNKALALLLQGWWTDAQIAIESALEKNVPKDALDVKNRALLFLAYSQLKYEYYRNARKSLRKISIDSQYANQGLLAMGLAALNQSDFLGAINAFTRLKGLNSNELSRIESYLMLAFTYESMGDLKEAELRYTEALTFFVSETLSLQKQILALRDPSVLKLALESLNVPQHLLRQFHFLNLIESTQLKTTDQNEFIEVRKIFNDSMYELVNDYYQKKISYIKSYQSQSQFALARLYDANQ